MTAPMQCLNSDDFLPRLLRLDRILKFCARVCFHDIFKCAVLSARVAQFFYQADQCICDCVHSQFVPSMAQVLKSCDLTSSAEQLTDTEQQILFAVALQYASFSCFVVPISQLSLLRGYSYR